MILPAVFFLLCGTLAESLFKGDECSLKNGSPGTCVFLNECQSALDQLIAGNTPDTICGYAANQFDPIICCPTISSTTTVKSVSNLLTRMLGDGRGEIARQKCGEYAKSVYTLKYSPSPIGGRQGINVSQCAVKAIPLVTNGEKADRMEFPHMAAIGYNLKNGSIGWHCGGTLISETFVLSAAHCTFSSESGNATWVRVGDLNLIRTDDEAKPVDRRIVERIKHPDYKSPTEYHDIALFRLETAVSFNNWIRPACLPTKPSPGTERAIATGWGVVNWMDEEGTNDLMKVTLSLVDPQICHQRWTENGRDRKLPNGVNADWSICASHETGDTCQGDSGGPLVVFSGTKYYCMYDVVGVTSLGKFCGGNFPSVYTRVYHYVPWIESVVWPRG